MTFIVAAVVGIIGLIGMIVSMALIVITCCGEVRHFDD